MVRLEICVFAIKEYPSFFSLEGRVIDFSEEKLQKASMAIGATTSVFSTTQMFKDSKEEEEIADLIQNAHNTYTTDLASSGSIPTTSGQLDNEYSIVREASVGVLKKSNIFVSNSVKVLHEVTNLNKED